MMSNESKLKWQFIAAASGLGFELLYSLFWAGFGHNIPPVSAALSTTDLAAFYTANHASILFGESMAAFVGVLWVPWTAQLTITMWRIEGSDPVLTIIQLIGGILTAWVLMFCPAIWATCAFRTDIDPNVLRTLNDLGFIFFNITYMGTTVQAIAMGIVGLADKRAKPAFPRWVSYWAIFTGLSFLPITFMPFFKDGPLAWNGLITFWALFGTYFVWTATTGWCMSVTARENLREQQAGRSHVGGVGTPAASGA
jgi:hypothetical protein